MFLDEILIYIANRMNYYVEEAWHCSK